MIPGPELEQLIQDVRTVTNKQVEIFDRLRHVEERLDVLVERLRKCEDRTSTLESMSARRPSRL
jgi:hypothetical protein